MSDLERFEELARIARDERPPAVEVVDGVMRRVRGARPAEPVARLWPLALGMSAAAAASLFLAMQTYLGLQEPFVVFLDSVRAVFL